MTFQCCHRKQIQFPKFIKASIPKCCILTHNDTFMYGWPSDSISAKSPRVAHWWQRFEISAPHENIWKIPVTILRARNVVHVGNSTDIVPGFVNAPTLTSKKKTTDFA